jgi:hypothetical protein
MGHFADSMGGSGHQYFFGAKIILFSGKPTFSFLKRQLYRLQNDILEW